MKSCIAYFQQFLALLAVSTSAASVLSSVLRGLRDANRASDVATIY